MKRRKMSMTMREAIHIAFNNNGILVLRKGEAGFVGKNVADWKGSWFTPGDPDRLIAYTTLEPLIRDGIFEHIDTEFKSAVRLTKDFDGDYQGQIERDHQLGNEQISWNP